MDKKFAEHNKLKLTDVNRKDLKMWKKKVMLMF